MYVTCNNNKMLALLQSYRICPLQRDSRLSLYASEAGRKRVAAMPFLFSAPPRPEGTPRHLDSQSPGVRRWTLPSGSESSGILWRIPRRISRRCLLVWP